MFFSYFVHDPDQLEFQHIKNREDVIAFWQTFSNEPNGGETEIGLMVERVADEISNRRLCNLDIDLSEEKPEILILNDGNDDVRTEEFPYKVNAISLLEFSEELRDLCNATNGKQIEITSDLRVFTHTKDVGKQEIKI